MEELQDLEGVNLIKEKVESGGGRVS